MLELNSRLLRYLQRNLDLRQPSLASYNTIRCFQALRVRLYIMGADGG